MSEETIILDVSSWQHPKGAPIDWHEVKANGVFGVIVKATQGTSYTSPYLRDDLWEAGAAGLWIGAYHFFDGPPETAKEQAEYFLRAIDGEDLELGAWLDWEPVGITEWEAKPAIDAFYEGYGNERIPGYFYSDVDWHTRLAQAAFHPRRWWAAAPSLSAAPPEAFMWQRQPSAIPGIQGHCDISYLINRRAFNLPAAVAAPPAPVLHADEIPHDEHTAATEHPPGEDGGEPAGPSQPASPDQPTGTGEPES